MLFCLQQVSFGFLQPLGRTALNDRIASTDRASLLSAQSLLARLAFAGVLALGSWAELSLAIRETLISRADLLDAATRWEASHPGHDVDAAVFLELSWQYGLRFAPPSRVAVLLPGEGSLAAAGSAIRGASRSRRR